jgi:hypothetical protein
MVSKFTVVVVAAAAVMIALLVIPRLADDGGQGSREDESQLNLEYSKQYLVRSDSGSLEAASAELLVVGNDGSAKYSRINGSQTMERTFNVDSESLKRIRGLILDTGYLDIPTADYPQKQGLANFTKYTLKVETDGGRSRTFSWVDPDSHEGTVPPIVINVGTQMDDIISRNT